MDVFDLFAKISLDTSDYERGLNEASKETQKTGKKAEEAEKKFSLLASATKVGAAALNAAAAAAKTASVAIGAASAAVGVLTKMSIEGYGDYEQLTGGVETLFKDSSDLVMAYANNAYKTAGLSANQYMETVTSFSASLLQSLAGDTETAAEVADLAITDMADNANKMGSSMESIQNAYQGFAKQNFTMLDNLKLGYGGTKEEMERLLTRANELNAEIGVTTDYQIDNYADIVAAIHLVQSEMGITGTTAKEAASTIQGSVAAAKSAWQNLVVGIADENADLDTLIGNFVDSVATAGENIIPRVEQILIGAGTAIQKLAPIISEQLPPLVSAVLPSLIGAGGQLLTGLLTGIISALPAILEAAPGIIEAITASFSENWPTIQAAGGQLLDMLWQGLTGNLSTATETAMQIITMLVSGITDALPDIASSAVEIITTLANGIAAQLPTLVPVAIEAILQLYQTFTNPDNLNNIVDAAIQIITSLADGIVNSIPTLTAKAPIIIANFVTAILTNLPKLLEAAAKIVGELAVGIIDNLPEIGKAAAEIITTIVTGINDLGWKILEVGVNIVKGIWNGITSMGSWLMEKVTGFFGGIVDGIKNVLGIHSPSTVAEDIFENFLLGAGNGLDDGKSGLLSTVDGIIVDVLDRFNEMDGADLKLGNVEIGSRKIGSIQTAAVDFQNSALGMASAATINAASAGGNSTISLTAQLVTPDGKVMAEYVATPLVDHMNANGTPIVNPKG